MRPWIPAAALLLAACGGADEPALPADGETPVAIETASEVPAAQASDESPAGIPEPLRGRWGMTVADCEPGRSDAKGLLVITADKLEFYESVGTLGETSERLPGRLRATFAFTGEGMNWTRDMLLETQDNGSELVRREFGADAALEPFRYQRCE